MTELGSTELTCREMVELMSDYLEGALADGDRALFEQHLVLCDGCSGYLGQMRWTVLLAGRLRDRSLDPPVRDRLLQTFRAWRGSGGGGTGPG
jgi:predicted anti-sigma-YlaC factor YlaD